MFINTFLFRRCTKLQKERERERRLTEEAKYKQEQEKRLAEVAKWKQEREKRLAEDAKTNAQMLQIALTRDDPIQAYRELTAAARRGDQDGSDEVSQ